MKEERKTKKSIWLQMLRIAAYLVLGILFLALPDMVISLLPVLLGCLLLFETIFKVVRILTLWKNGYSNWWILMIGCAVMAILGILLLADLFDETYTLIRILGGGLLTDGILEFWLQAARRKDLKTRKNGAAGYDIPNADGGYVEVYEDEADTSDLSSDLYSDTSSENIYRE